MDTWPVIRDDASGGLTIRQKFRHLRPDDLISATEIAAWAYCPEQWRLQYGLGLPSANQAEFRAGNRHHARKAVAERVAGSSIMVGRLLAVLAIVVLLLLIWSWL